jgi:HAD superfamily phosphoserine phosphatase-like hydrolase
MKNRVLTCFDIDGTCSKKQLMVEHELHVGETFPERGALLGPLRDAIATYERERTYDYAPVIRAAVDVVPEFYRGLRVDVAAAAAQSVIEWFGYMTYMFPRCLIKALLTKPIEERGLIVAISAGPDFLAEPFCELHGFDLVYSTPYEVIDGCYTGQRDDRTINRKGEVLDEIVEEFGLRTQRCIGIGDSSGDVPMLERVGFAFGVNPKGTLLDWIRRNQSVWVNDAQATGVTLFKPGPNLKFVETSLDDVLPDFVPRFDLPGSSI